MCGICGQFNFGDGTPVVPRDVERMTETLVHRGPDDEGYHVAGPVGLGFRRLSIIDLGGGHQPMSDARRRFGSSSTARSITSAGSGRSSKAGVTGSGPGRIPK
jgi:asparagine synthetase B (glutamine-hydrolysing)